MKNIHFLQGKILLEVQIDVVRNQIMSLMVSGRQNDVICGEEGRNDEVHNHLPALSRNTLLEWIPILLFIIL